MERINEIKKCKFEIAFFERELASEEYKEYWDVAQEWLAYWEDRLKAVAGENRINGYAE